MAPVPISECSEQGPRKGSLTSLCSSASRCISRSLAFRAACIWSLRAESRDSLWGAERPQSLDSKILSL